MSRFVWLSVLLMATSAVVLLLAGDWRAELLALLAAGYVLVVAAGVRWLRLGLFVDAVTHVPDRGKQVALTFDDGPEQPQTAQLLDLLAREGVRGTFFCIGRRAQAQPELARRIVREGHTIGNHSLRHRWTTNLLTTGPMEREIAAAQQAIATVTGQVPQWYRPPMGLSNPHLRGPLKRHGLRCIGWNVGGRDRRSAPSRTVEQVMRRVDDGSIILLHDGGADPRRLIATVETMIGALRRHGYNLVSLDDLCGGE